MEVVAVTGNISVHIIKDIMAVIMSVCAVRGVVVVIAAGVPTGNV